jgi:DNA-binding NtrC family response regulator
MIAERTRSSRFEDSDLLALPIEDRASVRLLIVEHDRRLRDGLVAAICTEGYTAVAVENGAQALELLKRGTFEIVLTELHIEPVTGFDVLRAARLARRNAIVIVITGSPSISSSIEALRAGAWDYLPKPFSAAHLQVLLGRAAHAVLQTRAVHELRAEVDRLAGHDGPTTLIGNSPAIRDAIEMARKVAPTDASVFLVGESGTGKELFAHFIHEQGRRASQPFITLNCGAMPESVLESALFGHCEGAFTEAEPEKTGLLESAHGGTLFLDELCEMSMGIQARLLRFLQDGAVRRVGCERTDRIVNVRFISSMSRDPQLAVSDEKLRADLLNCLRVFPIRIPPLRERREDIPLLATHFLANAWIRHRGTGSAIPKLTTRALQFLRAQPWRGNVRELRTVIEHVAVVVDAGQAIDHEHIPLAQHGGSEEAVEPSLGSDVLREPFRRAKERFVSEFERLYIRRLVASTGGNLARAARIADVDRTTLYRLIEKHHVGVRRNLSEIDE